VSAVLRGPVLIADVMATMATGTAERDAAVIVVTEKVRRDVCQKTKGL